ncbi:uncharacterized protein [Nicotiana sylvestris]|uniref:uncharacterized protein n=1 Tax=Nicotiana sylvestris TaxID=4096 RepID=UPI00388C71A3
MNLDSACGDSCMARPYSEIQLLLNNITANDHNWQGEGEPRRAIKQKAAGVLELDDFSSMRADIAKLANQMNRMTMNQTQQLQHVQQMLICCEMCGDNHTSDMCPTNPESIYYVGQQSRGPMNQQAQYGNTYNANWRNHPNFSWGENQSNQNQYRPQGNFNQPQRPPQQVEESHALCDLGASINLMSLSLYKKLGLGAPKPTTVMLQLADMSIAYPEGVIEDVLLKIGKFIFPVDFIILDFEADEKVPIILRRPLLATVYAIIKVREGKMIMRVDNEEVVFNVYKAIQLSRHYEELSMISVMEMDEQLIAPSVYLKDSLEKTIVLFESLEINDEVEEMKHILNASCEYMKGLHPFEPLNRPNGPPPKPSIEEAPKLELKPLPSHLHYAYLGSSDTLPVIISSDLSELQEEKLLRVLREHKRAIGWTMSDIRGISPAFYMHKILMEEGHKPSIEQQCRLNPNMKEVVRKEVIKWLDAGIVFLISDSKWVSPVQCVPKKGGMTVVTNENNDLIPIRTVNGFLEKDTSFKFDDACLKAFDELKRRLVTASIIIAPDWKLPFELMCDASDIAIGAVLGQRKEKIFYSFHYTSRTLNPAQMNYIVTEKELLTVLWAFDNFRSYLVGTKVIVYTDHSTIRYLFAKKDAKPRLIQWVLLLQEFDLEIRDRKGTENQIADQLSRLEN